MTKINSLHFLVHVFTSRKYFLPFHEGVSHFGNSMEELMRHVPSLRGPGVDVIIAILEKDASMGNMGLEAKDKVDILVPMDIDSEEKHNEGVRSTSLSL